MTTPQLAKVTPTQQNFMNEILAEVKQVLLSENIVKSEEHYDQIRQDPRILDDMALWRYCYGNGWGNKSRTIAMLKGMVQFQLERHPRNLPSESLEVVAQSRSVFTHGYDRDCCPILYWDMGKDNLPTDENGRTMRFNYFSYTYEKMINKLVDEEFFRSQNVYQFTYVVEVKGGKGLSLSIAKPVKALFDYLGELYAERVHRIIVLNVPLTANIIWGFIKPFLTAEQVSKYVFIRGNEAQVAEQLAKYISPDQLLDGFYGGKSVFDFDGMTQQIN